MTNFLIINEETKEFVNIDSIDSAEDCFMDRYRKKEKLAPIKSIITVCGKQLHCDYTPEEMLSKISELQSKDITDVFDRAISEVNRGE